jgi:hypothetical protein
LSIETVAHNDDETDAEDHILVGVDLRTIYNCGNIYYPWVVNHSFLPILFLADRSFAWGLHCRLKKPGWPYLGHHRLLPRITPEEDHA